MGKSIRALQQSATMLATVFVTNLCEFSKYTRIHKINVPVTNLPKYLLPMFVQQIFISLHIPLSKRGVLLILGIILQFFFRFPCCQQTGYPLIPFSGLNPSSIKQMKHSFQLKM